MWVIGISGASGSGKSYFATLVAEALGSSVHSFATVCEDCYYKDLADLPLEERAKVNFDEPAALDHTLLSDQIRELRNDQTVELPQYDYETHTRKSDSRTLAAPEILILDGILLLHDPVVRGELDLRLFVEASLDVCFDRRLKRDVKERGRHPESVLAQFENTVRPMYRQYIEPSRQHADFIVNGEAEVRRTAALVAEFASAAVRGQIDS